MADVMKRNPYYCNKKHRAMVEYICITQNDCESEDEHKGSSDEDIEGSIDTLPNPPKVQIQISTKKRKKSIYILQNKRDIAFLTETNKVVSPVYKTLEERMLYPINRYVGIFHASRNRIDDKALQELYWYNWELLCFQCPLWAKRFEEYGASLVQNESGKVEFVFKNDDDAEAFYDTYGYEFDEQTRDTQNKTLDYKKLDEFDDDDERQLTALFAFDKCSICKNEGMDVYWGNLCY
jgi:hypothetical protein